MPDTQTGNDEKKPAGFPSVAGEAGKWVDVGKKAADELSNNTGNRIVILILALLVGYFVWDKFMSGKDNAGSNLHLQNRADTATAMTIQILIKQVADKDKQIEGLLAEQRKSDSLAGEAATVIRRLRAGNEVKNINR